MRLHCEGCAAPCGADDVSLALGVAKCRACNTVFDLSGPEGSGPARPEREPVVLHLTRALPKGFDVEETENTTRISWGWYRMEYLFVGAWALALDVGGTGLLVKQLTGGKAQPVALLFLLVLLGAGVALTYFALAGFLNRTTLDARRDLLIIRHGPLPWPGNQYLPRCTLKQLFGTENARRPLFAWHGQGWDLKALDASGRGRTLVARLEEQEQVRYLEQALEKRLGLDEEAPAEEPLARRLAG
jgi:hypothetical protein